ncbi:polysaccharide deacetylase family protein [Flavobacterium sp. MAH-1]|uniref:Polysaccharide deacetylase family protein n=1 Tax=Flavobacterium agri TaxID=2743471 RepID=A0A7Y8Y331_9FLAO|nr:polysaccharide deacetylase family protein [Flavobacterium agri]NUY81577.1 polysaccharide deacetylase family protein [Flavobacterium agri]NYA71601.1 polysaccharide deacetylase family protein [Flavobacterium agri]
MKFYWIKTHWLIKKLFPQFVWSIASQHKKVYLTFDDGPIPEATGFVLEQLRNFNAKATFFCIGDNIRKNPDIFRQILAEGHTFGNHTFNHLNGWKTPEADYLENVRLCQDEIDALTTDESRLMRPPYAKVTSAQSRELRKLGYKIIMWDVLSADFDQSITPEKCLENVLKNIRPGSIVIFHDSQKALRNMSFALPETLKYLKENGFTCEALR